MLVEDFNDEAEARRQLQPWKRIADEFGCAVVLSAHPPKDRSRKGAARWRGSFARAEIVDIAFSIEGNFQSDTLTLELVKDRTGCAIGKLTLRKVGGFEVVEGADEDAASRFVLNFVHKAHEAGKPEVVRAEIVAAAKEAGWSEKTINNRLTALVQTGKLERPRRGVYRLPSQPDTPTPNDPSPQVPDFPTPNPLELRENEFPFFPEFPRGKKGIKGNREEPTPFNFPQFPQVREGKKGNSGNSGNSGTLPAQPTSDTYIENVGNVGNHETNAPNYRHFRHTNNDGDVGNVGNVGSCVTTVTELPTLPTNPIYMSDVGNPTPSDWQWDYIASDIPILPELVSFGNPPEQVSHANPTKPCQYTETGVSCPQSPEIPEPTYSTLRNEELIDTELLISELDELCVELSAQQKQSTLPAQSKQTEISEQPAPPEQTAQLPQILNKPTDTGDIPSLLEQAALPAQPAQPNPSLPKPALPDHLVCLCGGELRLFGKTYRCLRCDSQRPAVCRHCGKVLRLTPDGHAECVGCGTSYTFDQARHLWLCDEDTV
jgi:hypothetical protein